MTEKRLRYRMARNDTSSGHPKRVLFFDTETISVDDGSDKGRRSVLHFGVSQYVWRKESNQEWRVDEPEVFTTEGEFWDEVVAHSATLSGCRTLWVMAHNTAGFDFDVMGAEAQLLRRGYEIGEAIVGDPYPFKMEFRSVDNYRSRIIIADSMNWFRTSLESIGKSIGLPKGEDPGPAAPIEDRIGYCVRDVEILQTAMRGYIDFNIVEDLGTWAISLAGQSLNCFRHRFMDHEIIIDHRPEVVELERRALFGGRTEAFRIGACEVVGADRVSMYPAVMKKHEFPTRFLWGNKDLPVSRLVDWLGKDHIGIVADVTVHCREPVAPRFDGSKLCFSVGTFRTVLTSPELQLVLRHGKVLAVHEMNVYHTDPIFARFVEYWSSARARYAAEGNDLWALLCKNIQNSLYGKFGQRTPEWIKAKEGEVPDDVIGLAAEIGITGTLCFNDGSSWRWFGERFEKREAYRGESKWAQPAIAAFVTGHARAELWGLALSVVGSARTYCDTDSVYWTGSLTDMGDAIVAGKELGKWNEQEGGCMDVRSLKDYSMNGHDKIKGVKVHAKSTVKLGPGRYQQDQFRSHVGALREGEGGLQRIRRVTKQLGRQYNKGHVLSCGRVSPYWMDVVDGANTITDRVLPCSNCGNTELAVYSGNGYHIQQCSS